MTITCKVGDNQSITIEWDESDPIECVLNAWNNQDFIDAILNHCKETTGYNKNEKSNAN